VFDEVNHERETTMMAIRIMNDDGRFLVDDASGILWQEGVEGAAEYDSAAGALRDIEGEGMMNCRIVCTNDAGKVLSEF
jgi:hypothetical protein